MKNLHPEAPAPRGGKNAFHSGETTLAGFPIRKLLKRIDAALLVLKSCKGTAIPCHKPWGQLHRNGNVHSLKDAMQNQYDTKYDRLNEKYKVGFDKCFKNGKIDVGAEGPQWTENGPVAGNSAMVFFNNSTDPDQWWTPTNGTDIDESWFVGKDGEQDGYWDDWE